MLTEIQQFFAENAPQIKKTVAEGSVGGGAYAYTLNEWVAIATISYIAMQMGYLAWKWIREAKGKKK